MVGGDLPGWLPALFRRNGTTALTETVDTYFARLMGILDPEKPEDTPGKPGGKPQYSGVQGDGGGDAGSAKSVRNPRKKKTIRHILETTSRNLKHPSSLSIWLRSFLLL